MNDLPFLQVWRSYSKGELGKASLTGLVFCLLYGGITVTPLIMISMLYVPFMTIFLLLIYVSASLSFSYGMKQTVAALRTYKRVDQIDFDKWRTRMSVGFAILVFVVLSVIYLRYLQ